MWNRAICAFAVVMFMAGVASGQLVSATDTSFTYQGRLDLTGSPAQGKHTFTFRLFDRLTGGAPLAPEITEVIDIEDGLFTVLLDYGLDALIGPGLYLELEVTQDGGSTETLSPRQRLRASPAAVQSAAVSLLNNGTVVLQRGPDRSNEVILNTRPDEQFDDTSPADPFWQSFTMPTGGWIDYMVVVVKSLPDPDIFEPWTLRRGTGPLGEIIASGDLGLDVLGALSALNMFLEDPVPVVAGETYSFVITGTNLSFTEIQILDPNAGRSSAGPNTASFFAVYAATETVPSSQLLPDGRLQLSGSSPVIELEQNRSTNAVGITARHTAFGNNTQWSQFSFADRHQISFFPGVGARQWLLTFDGPNNRTGITEQNPLAKLHVTQSDLGLQSSALTPGEVIVVEHLDSVLGLYSDQGGSFGSGVVFGELAPGGALVDKWTLVRRTSTFNNELQFSYGPNANYSSNTINFALHTDGSAWLRGGLSQSSAADQKHDIQTLTDAIETLLQLRGVSYKWNHTDQPDIGFLAGEMAEVMPEIVGFDEAGKPIGIDYGRVTALIVEATKAQQRQIEDLLRRVEALEAKD